MRKTLTDAVWICLLAAIPTIAAAFVHPNRPAWDHQALKEGEVLLVTVQGWQHVLWVDARSAKSFADDHVPGAVLLNEDEWDELLGALLEQWRPGVQVVVYCSSQACQASAAVAQRLREEVGLGDVYVLKGGWEAWQNQ